MELGIASLLELFVLHISGSLILNHYWDWFSKQPKSTRWNFFEAVFFATCIDLNIMEKTQVNYIDPYEKNVLRKILHWVHKHVKEWYSSLDMFG